jgi:nitrite reductase/ring-hydroxylating ferredoxin subunit
VNHAAGGPQLPEKFVPVMPDSELREGEMKKADANGIPVLLVRRNAQVYAIAETCTHAGGPLYEGKVEDNTVTCPWHASRFDIESGKVIDGPATHPAPCFEVRVRKGQIEVRRWRRQSCRLDSVGINRHGGGNERVLRERSSKPSRPRVM